MPADPSRVVSDLLELRSLTSQPVDGIPQTVGGRPSDGPPLGSARLAWTEPWARARDWFASTFEGIPVETTTDPAGNLYVADDAYIRKVTPDGTVTTLAGGGPGKTTDGQGAAASFDVPWALAADAGGHVYVADRSNLIRKVAPDGTVSTLAGSGEEGNEDGLGTAASFDYISAMTIDAAGNLYLQQSNLFRKVTPDCQVTTLPLEVPWAWIMGPSGLWVDGQTLWYIDGHQLRSFALPSP